MKYFAKLGLNSKVIKVYLINNSDASTEALGIEFLNKQTGYPFWVQTFKDRSQRKNYAGKGYTYDEDRDAFISIKPYTSWVLNESTCQWEAPSARPDDGQRHAWNEETVSWDQLE